LRQRKPKKALDGVQKLNIPNSTSLVILRELCLRRTSALFATLVGFL
jgi:hypothetical protein